MYFDVLKEFGVPDEIRDITRSLEMADVKIDILDDYIRTSERFRVIRVFLEYRELREFAGRSIGPYWAIRERERGFLGQAARPPKA